MPTSSHFQENKDTDCLKSIGTAPGTSTMVWVPEESLERRNLASPERSLSITFLSFSFFSHFVITEDTSHFQNQIRDPGNKKNCLEKQWYFRLCNYAVSTDTDCLATAPLGWMSAEDLDRCTDGQWVIVRVLSIWLTSPPGQELWFQTQWEQRQTCQCDHQCSAAGGQWLPARDHKHSMI